MTRSHRFEGVRTDKEARVINRKREREREPRGEMCERQCGTATGHRVNVIKLSQDSNDSRKNGERMARAGVEGER